MRISIAQINPIIGNFWYNLNLIKKSWKKLDNYTDIISFPELSVCGYNPQDLALRKDFIKRCSDSIDKLVEFSKEMDSCAIIGTIREENSKIYNSAYVIYKGKIIHLHDKVALPNYGVFDDKRLFSSGSELSCFILNKQKIAIFICEDMWDEELSKKLKSLNPSYLITINASPYTKTKKEMRLSVAAKTAAYLNTKLIYINQVGLQDSIIYDGSSFVVNENNEILLELGQFEESISTYDSKNPYNKKSISCLYTENFKKVESNLIITDEKLSEIYQALMFALKDYLKKNNISKIVLGFSSGIDSTISSLIALDAIGIDNVNLVTLPSKYTSSETYSDANDFLRRNDISAMEISINEPYLKLSQFFKIEKESSATTEQNLQSRIRGIILMALSNKEGYLLLSTGNKSELAVGYATLYGDMNGGYNLIKDLYKLEIYQLANWRNSNIPKNSKHKKLQPIPNNILSKAPTAELSIGQKDSDSLPEYEVLDLILYNYIDLLKSKDEIIDLGFKPEIVDHVLNLVRTAQFKRNQSTLGPKISDMSFDLDWRYPITNNYI